MNLLIKNKIFNFSLGLLRPQHTRSSLSLCIDDFSKLESKIYLPPNQLLCSQFLGSETYLTYVTFLVPFLFFLSLFLSTQKVIYSLTILVDLSASNLKNKHPMQFLKTVSDLLFNTAPSSLDMITLDGALYLNHPDRIRGQHECLYPDAQIVLRRTDTEYQYQLVIIRVYDEDEYRDEHGDDNAEMKVFSVSETMQFHIGEREGSSVVFWADDADPGELYEFILTDKTSLGQIKAFRKAMLCSMYENKFQQLHTYASEADLEQLLYTPNKKQVKKNATDPSTNINNRISPTRPSKVETKAQGETTPTKVSKLDAKPAPAAASKSLPPKAAAPPTSSELPKFSPLPRETTLDLEFDADFYLFNVQSYTFEQHLDRCTVQLRTTRHPEQSYLCVCHRDAPILNQAMEVSMNHSFHLPDYAFVWNFSDVVCFSMALKFDRDAEYHTFRKRFTELYMQATLHQSLVQMKLDDSDYNYLMQQRSLESNLRTKGKHHAKQDEEYEADEEEEADELMTGEGPVAMAGTKRAKNSILNVGRLQTYVVRGNQLGVFGYTPRGGVVYKTTVPITFSKKEVNPTKALLHQAESKFVFTDQQSQPNKVFQMDLETQKIVRDWDVDSASNGNMQLRDLVNPTKQAQDPTVVGILNNALVTMDPRAPQVVQWDHAQTYKTNVDLSCASTTMDGAIAVGNSKGELRLFDRIGIRAKTQLQGASEPISHLDVSMDGKLVLATCQSHLLLFDVQIKETTGFHSRMSQAEKPNAIRLQLSPEDVVKLQTPVHFKKAYFDTSSKATSIVTSTGSYVVSWDVAQILGGDKYDYKLKRVDDIVVDDQFKHGDAQRIIMALPDDVKSVAKSTLRGARAVASASSTGRSTRRS